jgi:CubicO group peptidase (beta-lactamase class C family)
VKTRIALMLLAGSLASARADLGTAASYSAAHGERALLVCHRGKIVFERGPALVQTPRIYSITKSLFSIGAFRDARKGGISLERPVSRGPARGVKLAELMNQTSGLDPMSGEFYSTGLEDKDRVFADMKPPRRSRGFVYGAAHWEVLGEEISLASGTTLESWIMKHVPGAHAGILARWRRDGKGRMFLSTGARMSARELLPAGREVLAGLGRGFGRWPAAVRGLLSTGTPQNGMYALGFWLNRSAGTAKAREIDVEDSLDPPPNAGFWRDGCLSRHAPADLLAMIGSGGQRVYVVPSRQLVVIRLASGGSFSDAEFLGRYFAPAHTAQAGRTPRG